MSCSLTKVSSMQSTFLKERWQGAQLIEVAAPDNITQHIEETSAERLRRIDEILGQHHDDKLAARLDLPKLRNFVGTKLNQSIDNQIFIIPAVYRQKLAADFMVPTSSLGGGGYLPLTRKMYVFADTQGPLITEQSKVCHELAHAAGIHVYGFNKWVGRYTNLRAGLSLNSGYGNFLEEAYTSHVQQQFILFNLNQEFLQQLARFRQAPDLGYTEFFSGTMQIVSRSKAEALVLPLRYAQADGVGYIGENSLLAYAYDLISALLLKKGKNLHSLLVAARQSASNIKFLANTLNDMLGPGAYIKLQRVPYSTNTSRDEIISTVKWLQQAT